MHILIEINDITADDKATALPPLFVASVYRVFPMGNSLSAETGNGEYARHVVNGPAADTPDLAYAGVKKYADKYINEGLHVMAVFPDAEKGLA